MTRTLHCVATSGNGLGLYERAIFTRFPARIAVVIRDEEHPRRRFELCDCSLELFDSTRPFLDRDPGNRNPQRRKLARDRKSVVVLGACKDHIVDGVAVVDVVVFGTSVCSTHHAGMHKKETEKLAYR